MKDCILFLHGRYPARHFPYYRSLCRGRFKIAVDGGYRFFARSGAVPDLLIGDFDSLNRIPRNISPKTEVLTYPVDKDMTDTHLALEYCLEHRAKQIDIVQPTIGEPDHFTANLMLLTLAERYKRRGYSPRVRLINAESEIRYINSGTELFERADGDTVSVIPLSKTVELTCTGTAFDVRRQRILRGQTLASRNRIVGRRAVFRLKGEGLVFRLFQAGKRRLG
jgi:thiamine pyrophosphokinase